MWTSKVNAMILQKSCHQLPKGKNEKKREIQITKGIAKEIMADDVGFIEVARTNVFCHGCYHQKKNQSL